jgi:hypothetical protein
MTAIMRAQRLTGNQIRSEGGGEMETGRSSSGPIVVLESQERRNLTLVKRRRRRRDFLPFEK